MIDQRSNYSEYLDAVASNLDAPHPVCLAHLDAVVSECLIFEGSASKVSALKMFHLSWSSLRCATLLCRNGMVAQTSPVIRQSIESTVYGLLFAMDSEYHELWKARHDDDAAKNKFRYKAWNRAIDLIRDKDEDLSRKIKKTYDSLIDFGAHPNPLILEMISDYEIEPGAEFGKAQFSMILGQPYIDFAIINVMSGYDVLLDASKITWPEKWGRSRLKELDQKAIKSALNFLKNSSDYSELETDRTEPR